MENKSHKLEFIVLKLIVTVGSCCQMSRAFQATVKFRFVKLIIPDNQDITIKEEKLCCKCDIINSDKLEFAEDNMDYYK